MELKPELEQLLQDACCGNEEAYKFGRGCYYLWHGIDDIIDGDIDPANRAEVTIGLFIYAKDLYSTPFYQRNTQELSALVDVIFNAYADSVRYEQTTDWRHGVGDIIRSQGVDMISYIARICGGYEHMRVISDRARELSNLDQRT